MKNQRLLFAFLSILTLSGCGLYVPSKSISLDDYPDPDFHGGLSRQAEYESGIIRHIGCELAMGLNDAQARFALPWLKNWGTAVTILITAQEQSGISPGLSIVNPLENFMKTYPVGSPVTIAQTFSMGLGASASANATRSETIQVTWRNADLLQYSYLLIKNAGITGKKPCVGAQNGMMIDGDLMLREFVFDKAQIASTGEGNPAIVPNAASNKWPLYNTMTEEIIFLSAFGGSVTPSWKLARVSANSTSPLLAAQRTYTNDLIVTFGKISKQPTATNAAQLGLEAQNQHNSKVNASAIATSIQAQTH